MSERGGEREGGGGQRNAHTETDRGREDRHTQRETKGGMRG